MATFWPDNLHSRLVFWLKILLPLTALALLATLFLFGRQVRPEDAIPYADSTAASRAQQPRLTKAAYVGMTDDGSAIAINSADARPGLAGSSDAGSATDLSSLLEMPDGSIARITAGAGRMDQAAHQAILTEGVHLTSSNGYVVDAPGMNVGLTQTDVTSVGPVVATGPAVKLNAQAMHIWQDPLKNYLMDFTGGVTLVYTPPGGL